MESQVLPDPSALPIKPAAQTGLVPAQRLEARQCKSGDLLQDGRLYIEHDGQVYCLQKTKAGRLLLTK